MPPSACDFGKENNQFINEIEPGVNMEVLFKIQEIVLICREKKSVLYKTLKKIEINVSLLREIEILKSNFSV